MNRNPVSQRALSLLLSLALVCSIFSLDTVGAWATVSDSGNTDSADSGFGTARLALGSGNSTTLYADMESITIGNGTVTGIGESGTQAKPSSDGSYLIKQLTSSTSNSITVTGGTHDIYINSLNISSGGYSAFSIAKDAKVNLYLSNTNTLQGCKGYPGIFVPDGAELTISGGGSLKAQGGTWGAGIGGGYSAGDVNNSCGSVTINGGNVTAIGGSTGAGIGGGHDASIGGGGGGTITINGGTVTATGDNGAGIGGGDGGNGGTVTINGGTVTASGTSDYDEHGAGIGGGFMGNGGTVYISGGSVKASGNSAIGKGKKGTSDGTLQNKSGGSNVYPTTVTLPSKKADSVAELTLTQGGSAVSYGYEGMQADANGKLYLYLPVSDDTKADIRARDADSHDTYYNGYHGSVTNAGTNVLKMDPVLSVKSNYTYGDTISPTVNGSSSGVTFSYSGKIGSATKYGPSSTASTNCGDYTVSVTTAETESYYSKMLTADFSITQKDIARCPYNTTYDYTYTGSAIEPVFTILNGNTTLVEGTDYTVDCRNNTNVGDAQVTVKGINNYTGSFSKQFQINKASASVTLSTSPASGGAQTGGTVKLLATVTGVNGHSPTGTVEFYDSSKDLGSGTLSSGVATYAWSNVSAGNHTLKASYVGDNNYNTADGSISDYSIAKRTPTVSSAPSAGSIPYGSKLSASNFSGGEMVDANGTEVVGTFEWVDRDMAVNSSDSYEAKFTPYDTANYNVVSGGIMVPVTVTYADPTISVTGNITDQNQWAASIPLSVTTTTYDANASGSVTVAFKANGQTDFGTAQTVTGGSYTAAANGTYRFTVTDGRNKTASKDVTVTQIDDTLPNTPTITDAGKYTASNWYKASQTISAAFNRTEGSAEKLQYSLDGNTWTDGTSAAVSAEGTTTVSFRVIDALGRTGTQASVTVCIDLTAPTNLAITYRTNPVKNILNFLTFHKFFNDTVDGTLSAQDAGSGVDTYQYEIVADGGSLDQSKWVTSNSFSIQPDFKGTVYARAQDKVGNICEAVSDSIVTDHTKPSIAASYAYSGQKIYDSGAQIDVVIKDACAGVNQITYKVGAGTVQTTDVASGTAAPNGHYSFSIGSLPYGDYNVVIGAVDNSNNSADAITVPVSMASVSGVAVTGAPANATQGSTYRLGATVSGDNSPSQAVSWSLSGNRSANTKIDQSGTLTVGTDETAASLTVRTVSTAVPSVSGSVTLPVKARVLSGISVKTLPAKTHYNKGEALDPTGAVVTAAYNNGTSVDIPVTLSMVSGFDGSKTGTQNVTVTYSGMTTAFSVTVEEPSSPSGGSSGGSSAPSLPSSLTDAPTNTTVILSAATFPAWVTGVSLSASPLSSGGVSDQTGNTVYHLAISQTGLNLIGSPFVYNIQLLDQSGNPITYFTGTVTVKIPVPAGIHGTPHVFRYEESTNTFTDLGATVQDGYLVFSTTHFSYYVIAGTGDSVTLDTLNYQMPVGGKYQIGVKLTGSKAATVKFHSTNDKIAAVIKLKNGNYQVTGKGTGTVYIMFDVYDSKNRLLTHASTRVDVKTGIRPRGDSTRQIGTF